MGQATGTVSVTVLPNAGVVIEGTVYVVKDDATDGIIAALRSNDKGQIVGLLNYLGEISGFCSSL